MPKGKLAKFVQIDSDFLFGEKYQHLEHLDYIVYALIRAHWNGHNNGHIFLGLTEICKKCRCSKSSASRSLKRLQDSGVIVMVQQGHGIGADTYVPSKWELVGVKNLQPGGSSHTGTDGGSTAGVPKGCSAGVPKGGSTAGVPIYRLQSSPRLGQPPLSISSLYDADFEEEPT